MLLYTVVEYCKTIENKRTHDDAIIIFLHEQLAMLRTLNVHGCNISDKGTELIMEILMNTTSMQSFNISNTKLNTIKAAAVIRAFTLSKATIKSLNISRNCITISCIENIASALAQCITLEDLDISHNLLTFTGIVKIAESLRGHQNLKNLNLSNNLTSFHSEGEFFIDVILSTNQSLVYLNMCGRNIRPRFGNNHLFLPPTTELSTRFPLQNLYLSQLISFDMLTFKSNIMNMPDKCIKANREKCPFDQSIVSYYVDHDGGTFYNQDHDFAIVIPPGAVLQGECVEIKATASYFGPYQFPSGYHPVSSFFWASSNYTFKIPVYLIMSHYAVIRNVNDIDGLCVLQAAAYAHDHSAIMERKPMMEEVLNGVHFDFKMRYCIIATQHFCSFSVQDKSDSSLPQKFKVLCYDYKHSNEDDGEKYITDVCFCPNNCECSKVN